MNNKNQNILAWAIVGITIVALTSFVIYRRKKGNRVRIRNKNPKNILIVGDSQSAVVTSDGQKITYTYPNLLRKAFPDKTIDVLAIGGKPTKWMLDNLPSKLSKKKYDRVYIYGGGNDASSSVKIDTIINNIQKMVDMSKENGADVFVNQGWKIEGTKGRFGNHLILPLTRYVTTHEQWIPLIKRRAEMQKRIATDIKGANIIPIYSLDKKTNDGIHPTADGHKMVAEVYKKTLK